jgi:hypothetical protein
VRTSETFVQEYLFRRIREKLPLESLAEVVADLLHVSIDSAYRRIRGETPLVLEEAAILCEAFDLALDPFLKLGEKTVNFSYVRLDNEAYNFETYLHEILQTLSSIVPIREKQIIYLSKDIPFFHNFCFRPLFAFHHFFWMKSMLQHPDYVSRQFSMDLLSTQIENTGREILKAYNQIPSMEIWNTECINSTIAQVEYYREAGYFQSDEDIDIIYNALSDTIHHIMIQADKGSKFFPGESPEFKKNNFKFFHNRMVLGDNTIMALLEGKKILYLNYEVLNYMTTTDERFCNDVYARLEMLMRRATILSQVSEKQRNIFFNSLQRKIPKHISSKPAST